KVQGVKSMPSEFLEAQTKFKPGDYDDQAKVDADCARIKDWLGMKGVDARVTAARVYDHARAGEVTRFYEVDELRPARVGRLILVGGDRTKHKAIRKEVPLYPGQVLAYPNLRVAERNLARLPIFADAPVKPAIFVRDDPTDPDDPYKDVVIQAQGQHTPE